MAEYRREGRLIAVYVDDEFAGYAGSADEARDIAREYREEKANESVQGAIG